METIFAVRQVYEMPDLQSGSRFDIPVRHYLIDDRFWTTGGKKLGVSQFSADVNAIFPMELLSSKVGRQFASSL